jgi:hypothetical protein
MLLAVLLAGTFATTSAGAASSPPTDRTVKLDLIAKLTRGPEILILGDSRGRQARPAFVQRLTGRTAFNAAVTGGSTPDAWVFTRYTDDRFPNQKRDYIWFVSWGLATNIATSWLEDDARGRHYLQEVAPDLSPQPVTAPPQRDSPAHYGVDGSLRIDQSLPTPARAADVKAQAAQIAAQIRAHPPATPTPDPARFRLFEHLLAYVNARGERPVIVINPIYPTVYAALAQYGDPLTTSSLAYLHDLERRYDFVVVNCEDVRTWGGTASDWSNPTHVDRANMQRMLRYIVAHSDGALR